MILISRKNIEESKGIRGIEQLKKKKRDRSKWRNWRKAW